MYCPGPGTWWGLVTAHAQHRSCQPCSHFVTLMYSQARPDVASQWQTQLHSYTATVTATRYTAIQPQSQLHATQPHSHSHSHSHTAVQPHTRPAPSMWETHFELLLPWTQPSRTSPCYRTTTRLPASCEPCWLSGCLHGHLDSRCCPHLPLTLPSCSHQAGTPTPLRHHRCGPATTVMWCRRKVTASAAVHSTASPPAVCPASLAASPAGCHPHCPSCLHAATF